LFFELAVPGLDRTKATRVDTTSPVAIIRHQSSHDA
jgi:hypothetical protein